MGSIPWSTMIILLGLSPLNRSCGSHQSIGLRRFRLYPNRSWYIWNTVQSGVKPSSLTDLMCVYGALVRHALLCHSAIGSCWSRFKSLSHSQVYKVQNWECFTTFCTRVISIYLPTFSHCVLPHHIAEVLLKRNDTHSHILSPHPKTLAIKYSKIKLRGPITFVTGSLHMCSF